MLTQVIYYTGSLQMAKLHVLRKIRCTNQVLCLSSGGGGGTLLDVCWSVPSSYPADINTLQIRRVCQCALSVKHIPQAHHKEGSVGAGRQSGVWD